MDDASVIASVLDDGPGMTADVAARATEPFFSTKPGGSGMGLAIARAVVEELGGELVIASTPEGTSVALHVPLSASVGGTPSLPGPTSKEPRPTV